MLLLTPLEQFEIISIFNLEFFSLFSFPFTNLLLSGLIALTLFNTIFFFLGYYDLKSNKLHLNLIANVWQVLFENIYNIILNLLNDNLNKEGEKYFPFILLVFTFILYSNLVGLLPYNFTVTSHLIVTFSLSFSIFIGINIIGIQRHKYKLLTLFIPSNTTFLLALLLVPIEFISYIFKPVSLGVRLFANLMAGHTLLKVIVGFSWSMLLLENSLSLMHVFPLVVLVFLMGLELGVAVIQAYVFVILTCIYLNDSINLH